MVILRRINGWCVSSWRRNHRDLRVVPLNCRPPRPTCRSIGPICSSSGPTRAHCSRRVSITIVGNRPAKRPKAPRMSRLTPARPCDITSPYSVSNLPQTVDLRGAKPYRLLAHPVQNQRRLLVLPLDRRRAHSGCRSRDESDGEIRSLG
jgi:hypothetical protein